MRSILAFPLERLVMRAPRITPGSPTQLIDLYEMALAITGVIRGAHASFLSKQIGNKLLEAV